MDIVTSFPAYFLSYVHTLYVMPNIIYAGVIALFFGIVTARMAGVLFVPVIATIVYIAAQIVIPAVMHHAEIVAPVFNLALAKQAVALYIVFLVADTVVFGVKKAILAVIG
jgi:hypothetical protein